MTKKLGGRSGGRPGEQPGGRPGEQDEEQGTGVVLVSAESEDVYEHIESLKERYGEGEQGRVQVMRRMPDGTLVNLPSLPALTFDVDVVAAKYGGGRYEFKFYKGKEFLGRDSFTIDPAIKPAPEAVAVPVKAQHDGEAPSWLAATLDKMGDAITALANRPAPAVPAAPDPMAMIKAIGETMKALTPAAPPAPPPAPGLKENLEMIKSVVEVGTSILDARGSGGGSTGDAYLEVVGKLADPVIELVKAKAIEETARRRGRNPVTHLAPAPATAAAALPTPKPPAPEGPMTWVQEIQKWVPLIVTRCKKGRSAEDTAFFVCDELSDVTLKKLAEMAALPDFAEKATQLLPAELAGYPEWVTEFLASIQDWLFGDDDDLGADAETEVPPDEPQVMDLDEEAKRRMALLRDAPAETVEPKEPVPTS